MMKTRKHVTIVGLAATLLLAVLCGQVAVSQDQTFSIPMTPAAGATAVPPKPAPAPAPAVAPDYQDTATPLIAEGRKALETWNYRAAEKIAEELKAIALKKETPASVVREIHHYRARYCFYAGDYAGADAEMKAMAELGDLDDRGRALAERVEKLAELWKDAKEVKSEHFLLRYVSDKDVVIAGPALAALEKAYAVLVKELEVVPDAPVLVEVYPSFAGFSAATGLTDEELSDSGTIAVCKYRRLMVNTPRITSRGYAYQDTMSHEFVHFLVYERWAQAVPIWLHEGIAKHEEHRWRGAPGLELSLAEQSILASALRMNELISFDRMHPSFAKFKSPRQGQLAFAEVSLVVDYLLKKGGWPMIFRLGDELMAFPDYKTALQKVTGLPFDLFWQDWIGFAKSRGYKEIPGLEITAYEIKKGQPGLEDENEDEAVGEGDLAGGDEWKFARLGDLLRDREHYPAAVIEYQKAKELAPYSPRILNKLGLGFFLAKDYPASVAELQAAADLYPEFSTTLINLGRSLFALNKFPEAGAVLEHALTINPFNPIAYNYLIKLYESQGKKDKVEKLSKDLAIISGTATKDQPAEKPPAGK